ncbi:hypothetical protein Hamer_G017492 [Homarus americanus]|uniref:Uncharacterized protein n=1 Tax=Homarus americanus TaxID=6706 RepID=A0A8J5MQJ3_HOMAM|nr:hypothetical protein Hamer_G017492 [Homarus americanus]
MREEKEGNTGEEKGRQGNTREGDTREKCKGGRGGGEWKEVGPGRPRLNIACTNP